MRIRVVLAFASLTLALPAPAPAHTVAADGLAIEWSARTTPADNMGIIARDATSAGEYLFIDALGDQRTDVGASLEQDIRRFAVTGDADSIPFFIRAAAFDATSVPQVQITLDLDRVAGSGQTFLAGFADTVVADDARWEFLVQTRFFDPAAPDASVRDTTFAEVATASASRNALGEIEIDVPWTALGLTGPPATPIRISMATFRSTNAADDTVTIGDGTISNAIDSFGDCGDPRTSGFPNSWDCDLSDGDLDFHVDVWFAANGEVYSPLLVSHYVPDHINPPAEPQNEWVAIRNISPASVVLTNFKLGDEETPDGNEEMALFPIGATLAAGGEYIVGFDGTTYTARYLEAPDAEFNATSAAANMTRYAAWFTGSTVTGWSLVGVGDQVLILDPSNTILDVANYGAGGAFTGVTPSPATVDDRVFVRLPRTSHNQDTDDNSVDFVVDDDNACASTANCGNPCEVCVTNTCDNVATGTSCSDSDICNGGEVCSAAAVCLPGTPVPPGTSCSDGNVCNGAESCDGAGSCDPGTTLVCNDGNSCTQNQCNPSSGCEFPAEPSGTPCLDSTVCNGAEACNGLGACAAGPPLVCNDGNPCTQNQCNAVTGCQFPAEPIGTSCSDGNVCNGAELCDATGSCLGGVALTCNDGLTCTQDTCDTTLGCLFPPRPAGFACADTDPCNGAETCDGGGLCSPGTPLTCSDANVCTTDACVTGTGCAFTPVVNGTSCGNGDACDGAETCVGGACTPGTPPSCTDTNPCTDNSCVPSLGCQTTPAAAGTACLDADACNGAEACDGAGACAPGTPPTCADTNPCTQDTCNAATGCAFPPLPAGLSCADTDVCDGDETCDGLGACAPGVSLDCDDGNDCTVEACDPTLGCLSGNEPAGTLCADASACTSDEACDADGTCVPGLVTSCPDNPDPCLTSACNPLDGACVDVPEAAGTPCPDGDPCNGDETCDGAGTCEPGTPVDCPDAAVIDAAVPDAGPDAEVPDAALPDARVDAEVPDAAVDAGPDAAIDAGNPDARAQADAGFAITGGGCDCRASGTPRRAPAGGIAAAGLALLAITLLAATRRRRRGSSRARRRGAPSR